MYPHMIEVHLKQDCDPMFLNIDQIVRVYPYGENAMIDMLSMSFSTRESYDEIKALIRGAGCLIHKADPRLENKPLTMHDLQGMLGEPVWNSNTGKWTLVQNYIEASEPDGIDGIDVAFLLDAGDNSTGVTAGDLIKTPLYRMKEMRA